MNMETTQNGQSGKPILYNHLELLWVVVIWAGTFVATKMVLAELSPAVSALYRYWLASLILGIIDFRNPERIRRADYPRLVFLGATGVTFYYLLQHYGIKYTNATDAAILISLSPVFIGMISWFLLKERLKRIAVLGLVLAFTGCIFVITDGDMGFRGDPGQLRGNILILLTAISWAFYSVYGKKLLQSYSIRTIVKYTTWVGTVLLIPFSLPELAQNTPVFSLSLKAWLNLIYLGGLASVYGYLAWYRGLKRLPAVTVGSYLYFRPLLTGIFAAILIHERFSIFLIAGGCLILLGTFLTTR